MIRSLVVLMLMSPSALGLTREGHKKMPDRSVLQRGSAEWVAEMKEDGLVSLYDFKETSGPFRDKAPYVNAQGLPESLDLEIDAVTSGRIQRTGQFVKFLGGGRIIQSAGVATKIIRECQASNELSIEVWLRNNSVGERGLEKAPVIVSLSRETDDRLAQENRNFSLGLLYDEGDRIYSSVRTERSSRRGSLIQSDAGASAQKSTDFQHIVFTTKRTASGSRAVHRLYTSRVDEQGAAQVFLHREETLNEDLKGNFANWDSGARLAIGNELSYRKGNSPSDDPSLKDWAGEIHLLAIYCRALERQDIEGAKAPKTQIYARSPASLGVQVTPALLKSALIYKRLNGVGVPLSSAVLKKMEPLVATGDPASLRLAAAEATKDRGFLNITVRDFAARMSTRDESVNSSLNDFTATLIGLVRDQASAKDLLVGNYFYQADPEKASVPSHLIQDILKSNKHYEAVEKGRFDLGEVLIKKRQHLYDGKSGSAQQHPDPAGLITTRAFMGAHAIAGTNRRPVEFAFRQFLCAPLEKWADNTAPDDFVGRDIDRFPAGDHQTYKTTCRACHSVMDGFRAAFAYFDFQNGFTKYSLFLDPVTDNIEDDDPNADRKFKVSSGSSLVSAKLNHNDQKQGGPRIQSNQFVNNATRGVNSYFFGWKGKTQGTGLKDFGRLLADSDAFPKCMAERVFRSVCKRKPASFDEDFINRMGTEFSNQSYNLKKLFEAMAVEKACIGG